MNSFHIALGIFLITIVRTFIENFSNPEPLGGFTGGLLLVGYFLFYAIIVFSIGIFMGILLNESWTKHISRTLRFLPIIFIAPIIDIFYSGTACMAYIGTTGYRLFTDYITFFGPLPEFCGITPGIRIEVAIIVLFSSFYIWKKTRSLIKTGLGVFGIYTIIFINLALPGIVRSFGDTSIALMPFFENLFNHSLLGSIHSITFLSGNERFIEQLAFFVSRIPWVILVILIMALFWKMYPAVFRAWMKNIRITRIIYYVIIALSGIMYAVYSKNTSISVTFLDITAYILCIVSIIAHWWTAVAVNDIADVAIDEVSNKDRPMIMGTLTQDHMRHIAFVSGLVALTGSILVNWNVFALLTVFGSAYMIYSVPPFRLKKHFITSSLLIGVAGTAVFFAGYFLISPDQTFKTIPLHVFTSVFISLILLSHTKDFKDVPGDKREGIKTLPVVFGTRKASKILTWSLLIWVLFLSLLFANIWIFIIGSPLFLFDLIIKKRIPEYIRFITLFIQIILMWFVFMP